MNLPDLFIVWIYILPGALLMKKLSFGENSFVSFRLIDKARQNYELVDYNDPH